MEHVNPDDDNRVFLTEVEGHTEYKGDYINASYIDVSWIPIFPIQNVQCSCLESTA